MVTNDYNASNGFSSPVRREPSPYIAPTPPTERKKEITVSKSDSTAEQDKDTLLLLGVLCFLFLSDCKDRWLLVALGYLLFF